MPVPKPKPPGPNVALCHCCGRRAAFRFQVGNVTVIDCRLCDRSRCERCHTVITDRFTRQCTCGADVRWAPHTWKDLGE